MNNGFLTDTRGVTAIEYGLIGVLILVAAIPAMVLTGDAIKTNLYDILEVVAAAI